MNEVFEPTRGLYEWGVELSLALARLRSVRKVCLEGIREIPNIDEGIATDPLKRAVKSIESAQENLKSFNDFLKEIKENKWLCEQ